MNLVCVQISHVESYLMISNTMSLLTVRELEIPGEIYERKIYPFEFSSVEMPYESYNGTNVRLRYANAMFWNSNHTFLMSKLQFAPFQLTLCAKH